MKVGFPVSVVTEDGKRRQGTITEITGHAKSLRKVLSIAVTIDGEKETLTDVHHELDTVEGANPFWLQIGEKRSEVRGYDPEPATVEIPRAFPEVPTPSSVPAGGLGNTAKAKRRNRKTEE